MEKYKILESRKLAEKILNETLNQSLNKTQQELRRSVATDTRSFEKMNKEMETSINSKKLLIFNIF